ncbi:hypothetical protein [Azospirillum doebereinerae]|uniref:DUF1795 domain-containing protein n=1 Tax=Azospirillum doebereinerae TaxID=92933 RepID=A0A433JBC3_9PROT|nr:hypothetical protein [Azospirillum doebereinerae]RUQ73780.1 hypothetical protein EJ913_08985 [Azospirillum doebereinerae]
MNGEHSHSDNGRGDDSDGRIIGWNDTVRFRLPSGWAAEVEEHEGQPVATFRPPPPAGGTLRLVTDRVTPKPEAGGVAATLREMALRFVRPQDQRAGDRTVETRADGALVAQAVMMTDEDGRAETHYLWLVGAERDGQAAVAMFSYALPAILDGDESCAAMLGRIDAAIQTAELL